MAIFHLHEIRTNIDILSTEKCKVTFSLNFAVHIFAGSVVILFSYSLIIFRSTDAFVGFIRGKCQFFVSSLLTHRKRRLTRLIDSIPIEPLSVCVSVCVSVRSFKDQYLHNQRTESKQILSKEPLR